jgi:hypothetical protein
LGMAAERGHGRYCSITTTSTAMARLVVAALFSACWRRTRKSRRPGIPVTLS